VIDSFFIKKKMSIYDFHQFCFILQFYYKIWNHFFNEKSEFRIKFLINFFFIFGCGELLLKTLNFHKKWEPPNIGFYIHITLWYDDNL
jgi:hypothetical protein